MSVSDILFRPKCVSGVLALLLTAVQPVVAQPALTWQEVKTKFEAVNPTLQADEINVQEMKAEEITAFLRPNPGIGLSSRRLPDSRLIRRPV